MNMAGADWHGVARLGGARHGKARQAPPFRAVNALNGEVATHNSKFWAALAEADEELALLDSAHELACRVQELEADATVTREAFAAAVGFYDCPCGSEFEFFEDSSLEEYARLNIWLGRHVPCSDMVTVERDDLAERLTKVLAQLKRMQATR